MSVETECKIPVPSLPPLAARLRALGAEDEGTAFERNWVFDTPDEALRAKDMLLRLRSLDGEAGALLTVKTPSRPGAFKTRGEFETRVESADAARACFEALGYAVRWVYEKRRTRFRHRDCEVMLDDLPEIGGYLEVEGSEAAIRAVLADLGVSPEAHVRENYLVLFEKHCRANGGTLRDMRFPPAAGV